MNLGIERGGNNCDLKRKKKESAKDKNTEDEREESGG